MPAATACEAAMNVQVVGRELRGHMTAMKKIAVGE